MGSPLECVEAADAAAAVAASESHDIEPRALHAAVVFVVSSVQEAKPRPLHASICTMN